MRRGHVADDPVKPAGDEPDQVPRLRAWKVSHPGWDICPPNAVTGGNWRATSPDKTIEVTERELRDLLDELEKYV